MTKEELDGMAQEMSKEDQVWLLNRIICRWWPQFQGKAVGFYDVAEVDKSTKPGVWFWVLVWWGLVAVFGVVYLYVPALRNMIMYIGPVGPSTPF